MITGGMQPVGESSALIKNDTMHHWEGIKEAKVRAHDVVVPIMSARQMRTLSHTSLSANGVVRNMSARQLRTLSHTSSLSAHEIVPNMSARQLRTLSHTSLSAHEIVVPNVSPTVEDISHHIIVSAQVN